MQTDVHKKSHFALILQKGSWYLFSAVLTKVIGFLMLKVITGYLPPDEFGILSYLETIGQLLPVLISLGLDEAYYRFFFKHNGSEEDMKKYISSYFWVITVYGVVVVAVSMVIGKLVLKDVPFFPFIPLTMIGPLILQVSVLGSSYLKQQLKSELFSVIYTVTYVTYLGSFMIMLVVFKMGMVSKVWAIFFQNFLTFAVYLFVLLKDRMIVFSVSIRTLKEGLRYSIPLLPNQLSYWVSQVSDRILIKVLKSSADLGLYSAGYMLGQQPITIIANSIFNIYKPLMFTMMEKDIKESAAKIEKFIAAYFFVMFSFAFALSFFAREIIIVMTSAKYYDAYQVIPVVAFAYFFSVLYKPFYNIISFYGKTWVISAGFVVQALVNVVLNIILIPHLGSIAAAWTTLISYLFSFVWIFLFSQRMLRIRIDYLKVVITVGAGLLVEGIWRGIVLIYPAPGIVAVIAVKTVLVSAVFLFMIYIKVVDISVLRRKKGE